MSESFQMLVDQDVQIEDASDLEARVLHRYREDGLIMGEANADCVLGPVGYRPGPAIPESYELRESRFPFLGTQDLWHRSPTSAGHSIIGLLRSVL